MDNSLSQDIILDFFLSTCNLSFHSSVNVLSYTYKYGSFLLIVSSNLKSYLKIQAIKHMQKSHFVQL